MIETKIPLYDERGKLCLLGVLILGSYTVGFHRFLACLYTYMIWVYIGVYLCILYMYTLSYDRSQNGEWNNMPFVHAFSCLMMYSVVYCYTYTRRVSSPCTGVRPWEGCTLAWVFHWVLYMYIAMPYICLYISYMHWYMYSLVHYIVYWGILCNCCVRARPKSIWTYITCILCVRYIVWYLYDCIIYTYIRASFMLRIPRIWYNVITALPKPASRA